MIKVTEFSGIEYYLNPDCILRVDKHPDTTITLTTGKKVVVKEPPENIVDKYIEVKRKIFSVSGGN
ncbi:MAG: flagellar FlbD family protein [Candidatus Muiribacteriota bacterium]